MAKKSKFRRQLANQQEKHIQNRSARQIIEHLLKVTDDPHALQIISYAHHTLKSEPLSKTTFFRLKEISKHQQRR